MRYYYFPDLSKRNTSDKELLELANVDMERMGRTIRQFKRINYLLSGSRRLMREHFFRIMLQHPEREYTLLDVGAGGCDMSIWAACEARRKGLKLKITALDNDRNSLSLAYQAICDYPEISIVEGDARALQHLEAFDFVFSNHLLHHLDWHEIKVFLDSILPRTRIAFVMNDLKRSRWAYLGFTLFSALLTRGSYHFYDGLLSIRRAFLPEELRSFLQQNFPDRSIKVIETYPARLVLAYSTQESPLR
ncbi:MAG: methyltransferase domain-containing protein [Pelovirga sp.]